jgi:hypothetical protein
MLWSVLREALLSVLCAVLGMIVAFLLFLPLSLTHLVDGNYALVALILIFYTPFAHLLAGILLAVMRPWVPAVARRPLGGTVLPTLLLGLLAAIILNPLAQIDDLPLTLWFVLPGFALWGLLSGRLAARPAR